MLLSGVAAAEPLAKTPTHDWGGLYFGGHAGWGWVNEKSTFMGTSTPVPVTVPAGTVTDGSRDGVLGGLQGGLNWQVGHWVLGAAADVSWTDAAVQVFTPSPLLAGGSNLQHGRNYWYATATGRVGYAWGDWLLYADGGAAWDRAEYDGSATAPLFGGTVFYPGFTNARSGWTVGAGVERVLWGQWSWKAEYSYMDFGTFHGAYVPLGGGVINFSDSRTKISVVKLGLNYKIDWAHTFAAKN